MAVQAGPDAFAEAREHLRSAYLKFRERSSLLAAEILRDLPDYTVHDITHIDSLWHLADLIAGDSVNLTPMEAFVLGGAFLIHDLGNGLAAYPDGIAGLRTSPVWDDEVGLVIRSRLGRAPTTNELRNPTPAIEREVLGRVLRRLHAEHAERLALVSWSDPKSGERFHLMEDSLLRQHLGKLIGRIAHSHWWPARRLPAEFGSILGPPAGFPREWTIDPMVLACLLRVADAAHLDNARAPLWLKVIRRPSASSAVHWDFQEKLNQPIADGDRLLFTSAPFSDKDMEAWWMCFDALELLDRELADADGVLADSKRKQFAIRGVHGAGQADRLFRWVQTEGWLPVDTRIRVNDVAALAKELGGEQLYGDNRLTPLRELIQNASDATRARSCLQSWPPERGEVVVRVGKDQHGHFIEVCDNGVGMSQAVMTEYLLDFGRSFWSGTRVSEELPGLLASGFEPTGKYGVGFFSVFMWSDHVRVTSRRYDRGHAETSVLEFMAGLDSRPLFREATASECLDDGGTHVRVWLDSDPEGTNGVLRTHSDEKSVAGTCLWLCPALDVNLFVERQGEAKTRILSASDWKTISDEELIKRIHPNALNEPFDEDFHDVDPSVLFRSVVSMLRPLHDAEGNLVGRMALVPAKWHYEWSRSGTVTVGGFRSASTSGSVGILIGRSVRASRDSAIPLISKEEFYTWLREQEQLVATNTKDPEILLECAQTLRGCGMTPEILPIAEGIDGLKNASQIREWKPAPDQVVLLQDVRLWRLRRKFDRVELLPNVLAVDMGMRPFIEQNFRFRVQWWPDNPSGFHRLTLAGAVAYQIATLWQMPPEDVLPQLETETSGVVIGAANGKTLRASAVVLTRPGSERS